MEEQKIIITVSGEDNVGIVSQITKTLAECTVNIEDIKQTLMQGQFVMILMGDISKSTMSFKEIKLKVIEKANSLSMEAWIQRKGIFDKMHMV